MAIINLLFKKGLVPEKITSFMCCYANFNRLQVDKLYIVR